jgi:hypothetical protein
MSRRSKQSNVVPINIADELDDLLSAEAIKPNLAFLGLSIGAPAELDQFDQPQAGKEELAPEVATSASGAVIGAPSEFVPAILAPSRISASADVIEIAATDADINLDEQMYPPANLYGSVQIPEVGRHGGRPVRIHKCVKAQDGHSHIENELYGVLRRAGRAEDATSGSVIVQVGSAFLCRETRVHKRNIGTLLRRLVFKKSIEVIQEEVSSTRTARRYRVFSYTEILKRRREAGLEWVVRRRGVEFVDPTTGYPLYKDSGDLDDPGMGEYRITAPDAATTSGAVAASGSVIEAPPLDLPLISEALQCYWETDFAAVEQLARSCALARPDCTAEEIVHFIHEKGYVLSKNVRGFTNPVGFMLSSVPRCFEGVAFDQFRKRAQIEKEHQAQEERRKQEEEKEMMAWMRNSCLKTLSDPKASAKAKDDAASYLWENFPSDLPEEYARALENAESAR